MLHCSCVIPAYLVIFFVDKMRSLSFTIIRKTFTIFRWIQTQETEHQGCQLGSCDLQWRNEAYSNARALSPNSPTNVLPSNNISMASCLLPSKKLLTMVLWTERAPSRSLLITFGRQKKTSQPTRCITLTKYNLVREYNLLGWPVGFFRSSGVYYYLLTSCDIYLLWLIVVIIVIFEKNLKLKSFYFMYIYNTSTAYLSAINFLLLYEIKFHFSLVFVTMISAFFFLN